MNALTKKTEKYNYPSLSKSDRSSICTMVESSAKDIDLSEISGDPTVDTDLSQSSLIDSTSDSTDSDIVDISRRWLVESCHADRVNASLDETLDKPKLPLQSHNVQEDGQQESDDTFRYMCSICNVYAAAYSLSPCQHKICNLCYQINFRSFNEASAFKGIIKRICDICFQKVDVVISFADQDMRRSNSTSASTAPSALRSLADSTSYRRLSPHDQISGQLFASIKWSVVKLSNIPWDISVSQIAGFFQELKLPQQSIHSHSIHVMIDRSSGKTLSNAFVELKDQEEAHHAIVICNRKPLKGRLVHVSLSSQDELLNAIFPSWSGDFLNGMAVPADNDVAPTKLGHTFITRQEINSLLTICRNYKIHFSRKCPERPFENVMSIVCKYPWYQPDLVTALQRDHIYECLKLAIECLCSHVTKDYITIDPTLPARMVRTGLMCPTFTERQQTVILNASGQECPEDAKSFIISNRPPASDTLSDQGVSHQSDIEETVSREHSCKSPLEIKEKWPQKNELKTWDYGTSKNLIDLSDDDDTRGATIKDQLWQPNLTTANGNDHISMRKVHHNSLDIVVNNHPSNINQKSEQTNQLLIEERIKSLCQQLKSRSLEPGPLI